MPYQKTKVWSFEWDDAGGPGLKLFSSEEELHAYLYNQAVTCESKRVQRLLSQNKIKEAYLAWREVDENDTSGRYEWNVQEIELAVGPSTSVHILQSGRPKAEI